MNIWLKRLPLILCSGFFFPASCTVGSAVSLPIIAAMDSRDVAGGDDPHSDFFILVVSKGTEHPLALVSLKNLQKHKVDNPTVSYILPKKKGSFRVNDYATVEYTIIQAGKNQQTIEAKLTDDDGHVLSRYRVSDDVVIPLYSEGYYKAYAFIALRNGIVFGLALYFLGKAVSVYVRRKEPECLDQA